jgi:hypothetical protein
MPFNVHNNYDCQSKYKQKMYVNLPAVSRVATLPISTRLLLPTKAAKNLNITKIDSQKLQFREVTTNSK